MIRFDYDDQFFDTVNKINSELLVFELQIKLREEPLDGYELGDIVKSTTLITY